MTFKLQFEKYKNSVEAFLNEYFKRLDGVEPKLLQSMKYSLLGDGKRVRPALLLGMYELCGGKSEQIYSLAAAVEMIHTYSLIHDDLPCMDDDTIRRGKPCNHISYGESTALLAGDALLTLAFEVLYSAMDSKMDAQKVLKCSKVLAHAAGCSAMISGQSFDLNVLSYRFDADRLLKMYNLKTAALITASVEIAAIFADVNADKVKAAQEYGQSVGLCYQIVDDILDGEEYNLSLLKNPCASDLVKKLNLKAKNALDVFDKDTKFLKNFADYLTQRIY